MGDFRFLGHDFIGLNFQDGATIEKCENIAQNTENTTNKWRKFYEEQN